jgi:hypothetical protein
MSGPLSPQQFFHGTTHENAESIMRTGLRATTEGNYTLIRSQEGAKEYAEMDRAYSPSGQVGVVAVSIPHRVAPAYYETRGHPDVPEEADDGSGNRAWLRRDIPPKYIKRVI